MEYYPGPREELIEEALRKIACDRLRGVYLDDGAGVQFTLYEMKKELKERGHDIDKADLLQALKICNLTNISIQAVDGKAVMQSAIFPTLLIASREDWLAAPQQARCYVQFGFDHGVGHPLLLLCNAKAPNYRKNKAFKDFGHYSEWPKVADAMIEACNLIPS